MLLIFKTLIIGRDVLACIFVLQLLYKSTLSGHMKTVDVMLCSLLTPYLYETTDKPTYLDIPRNTEPYYYHYLQVVSKAH